jgi:hypothetical protein
MPRSVPRAQASRIPPAVKRVVCGGTVNAVMRRQIDQALRKPGADFCKRQKLDLGPETVAHRTTEEARTQSGC